MRSSSILRCVVFSAAVWVIGAGQAMAQPGAATLVSPNGEVQGSTTTFTWEAVPGSTWYLLWIGTPPTAAIEQWYTAQQVGCVPDTGTCSVSLTLTLPPGAYTWHVRTWNPAGPGSWSFGRNLSIKDLTPTWSRKLPADRRFTLVFDGLAVLDHETGLVWERVPSTATMNWAFATQVCSDRELSNRFGWRLPTVAELTSLVDSTQTPRLPAGHPFVLGDQPLRYWTVSVVQGTFNMYVLDFVTGLFGSVQTNNFRALCVRGPGTERLQ